MQQASAVSHADLVLCLLVASIQRRKVDIGGCLVDVYVFMRRAEDPVISYWNLLEFWGQSSHVRVNNQSSKGKHHA